MEGECIAFANERAPALDTPLGCLNTAATTQCTLSDFHSAKYVVLWFYPDDPTGIQDANNLKEALSFEKPVVTSKSWTASLLASQLKVRPSRKPLSTSDYSLSLYSLIHRRSHLFV